MDLKRGLVAMVLAGTIAGSADAATATREAFGRALVELGRENKDVVVCDADLSKSTMTTYFAKEFPERFFSFGIAEANMVAAGCGMAYAQSGIAAAARGSNTAAAPHRIARRSGRPPHRPCRGLGLRQAGAFRR